MLRCLQLGLTVEDLDHITVGFVFDMCAENSNDSCEDAYTQIATQDDFDQF